MTVSMIWIMCLAAIYVITEIVKNKSVKTLTAQVKQEASKNFITKHSYADNNRKNNNDYRSRSEESFEDLPAEIDDDYFAVVQDANDAINMYFEKYSGADDDADETSIDNSELEYAIDIYKTQSPSTADSTSIDKVKQTTKKIQDTEIMGALSNIKELNDSILFFKELIAKEVPE